MRSLCPFAIRVTPRKPFPNARLTCYDEGVSTIEHPLWVSGKHNGAPLHHAWTLAKVARSARADYTPASTIGGNVHDIPKILRGKIAGPAHPPASAWGGGERTEGILP